MLTELLGTPLFGSALTLGTALTGVATGIATGLALKQINDLIGLTNLLGSRGSSALAGAGGGAAAGAIIGAPLWAGAALGAIIGALVGALFGWALRWQQEAAGALAPDWRRDDPAFWL